MRPNLPLKYRILNRSLEISISIILIFIYFYISIYSNWEVKFIFLLSVLSAGTNKFFFRRPTFRCAILLDLNFKWKYLTIETLEQRCDSSFACLLSLHTYI